MKNCPTGIAVFPQLGLIAERVICDGMTIVSEEYSYKPGQWGVTRDFFCPDGSRVTFRVLFACFAIYSAMFFIGFSVLRLLRGRKRRP